MLRKMSKRISRVVLPSGKMQVKNPHFVACDRSDALQLPGFVCSYQLIYELIPSCSDLEMSWSCNDEAITVTGKKRWLAPKLYIRAHVPYIFYMVAHIPWILTHSGTYSTRTHIYIYISIYITFKGVLGTSWNVTSYTTCSPKYLAGRKGLASAFNFAPPEPQGTGVLIQEIQRTTCGCIKKPVNNGINDQPG